MGVCITRITLRALIGLELIAMQSTILILFVLYLSPPQFLSVFSLFLFRSRVFLLFVVDVLSSPTVVLPLQQQVEMSSPEAKSLWILDAFVATAIKLGGSPNPVSCEN